MGPIGAGSIGQAIARRISAGKHVLLADLKQENADDAAEVLSYAGFEVSTAAVDISLPRVSPRARRGGHCAGHGHRRDPRRVCLPVTGISCHHPEGGLIWSRARAGGVRQRDSAGRRRSCHRLPIRTQIGRVDPCAKCDDTDSSVPCGSTNAPLQSFPTALAVLRSHQIKVLRNRSDKKPNSRVPRIPHAAQRWSSAHRDTRSREMKDHGRPR
jgi:hypothetical protein